MPPYAPYTKVQLLLNEALAAIEEHRLTRPANDNALHYLQQVLELEPYNQMARDGMDTIVHEYLGLATKVLQRGDFAAARAYLTRASAVDPDSVEVAKVRQRLAAQAGIDEQSVPLDPATLTARAAAARNQLMQLGTRAKTSGTRVVIVARSDAEGRWIFQQMNAAPGSRLRGELQIGATPRVTLQQISSR